MREREETCLLTSASGEHATDPGGWGEKDLGISEVQSFTSSLEPGIILLAGDCV